MKKRSLGKMFLLFVVTLGIYRIYWIYKTRKEMVSLGQKIPSLWILVALIVLLLVIGIGGLAVSILSDPATYDCTAPADVNHVQCQSDYSAGATPVLGIVGFYLAILAIGPAIIAWFWPYCKAVEQVTKEKLSFALAMVSITLIPDGFDILVIQDGFNKVAHK